MDATAILGLLDSSPWAAQRGERRSRGCLGSPGTDADVVIVDPDREAVVHDQFNHCLFETSIYGGYRFRGMARTTIVPGRVMMNEFGTVGTPGWGRYVPRGAAAGGRL